jgi:hypothetical protein
VIRRWLFRGPAPAADRKATEREALADLRSAEIEQQLRADNAGLKRMLAERDATIAERDAQIIRLTARLRVAEVVQDTTQWMRAPARAARNLDAGITSVVPASLIRKPEKGRHR